MKKLISILIVLLPTIGFCQYIPQFSQLIKTLEFVNPGYNASKDLASAVIMHRNQWTGFEGAPKTYALNLNIPVNQWHAGFGANMVAEKRGLIMQTNADLTACVDVKMTSSSYMAFGLALGVESKRIDIGRAVWYDRNLPYTADMFNCNNIHTGIGLNYFSPTIHLGGSMHLTPLKGSYYNSNEFYSIYLNGSYLYNLNEDWALKPSALFRYFGGYADLDYGIFVLYKDIVWAGITNRLGQALIFFADVKINYFMRVGYSYDIAISSKNTVNYGSHEIRVELNLPRKSKTFERLAAR
jgi:type IX secretion system PorP/SprF family membrane protein